MKKLRAAVVGVGYLGRFHAQKYKANPNVDLVAVCDGRTEQAQAVATELGVRAVSNPRELIGQVDLVTVAASTQAHYELGKMFLEAGIPVNLEKPLAATADQARELVELSEKKKVFLSVGHIERFNPAILELRRRMKNVQFFEFVRHTPFRARGADVSVLSDLMIHDLDLLFWLSGSRIKDFKASGSRLISKTFDTAEAFVELEDGRSARISASRVSTRPQRSIRLLQNGSILWADTGSLDLEFIQPIDLNAAEPLKIEKFTADKKDALQTETDAFIQAILEGKPPAITGRDGLMAVEAVEKIERSLK